MRTVAISRLEHAPIPAYHSVDWSVGNSGLSNFWGPSVHACTQEINTSHNFKHLTWLPPHKYKHSKLYPNLSKLRPNHTSQHFLKKTPHMTHPPNSLPPTLPPHPLPSLSLPTHTSYILFPLPPLHSHSHCRRWIRYRTWPRPGKACLWCSRWCSRPWWWPGWGAPASARTSRSPREPPPPSWQP